MTVEPDARAGWRDRHRDRMRALRWLAAVAVGALLFALGVSVGEALRDNPLPGVTTTDVTTIHP